MGTSRRSSQINVGCKICDVVHDVVGAVVLARGKVEMAKSVFIWTCLHQEVIIIPLNKPEIILRATMVIDQLCQMYFLPLNVPLKDSVGAHEAAKLGLGAFTVTWDFFLCYQCLKTCTWFKRWQRQDTCLCCQSLHPEKCCVLGLRFQAKKWFLFLVLPLHIM